MVWLSYWPLDQFLLCRYLISQLKIYSVKYWSYIIWVSSIVKRVLSVEWNSRVYLFEWFCPVFKIEGMIERAKSMQTLLQGCYLINNRKTKKNMISVFMRVQWKTFTILTFIYKSFHTIYKILFRKYIHMFKIIKYDISFLEFLMHHYMIEIGKNISKCVTTNL